MISISNRRIQGRERGERERERERERGEREGERERERERERGGGERGVTERERERWRETKRHQRQGKTENAISASPNPSLRADSAEKDFHRPIPTSIIWIKDLNFSSKVISRLSFFF